MFETALNPANPAEDYKAKTKALQDLESQTGNDDPEIKTAIAQRKADLDKEAQTAGVKENEDLTHGKSPEELGGADAYYHRPYNPAKYGFANGSPESQAYAKGFKDYDEGPSGGKQWD